MIRRVSIANLAPTGEGVSKTPDGVGFIAGALPGEEVEAEVLESRRKFWKGRAVSVSNPSSLRRSGPHADGCAGCDWSYFDVDAAARAKRLLFLETMERIGELSPPLFGDLPIETSPLGYRLRSRLHVSGSREDAEVGYFAPRTHRVESAEQCRHFVGVQERQVGRAHDRAEARDVQHRADARVEQDATQDRPPSRGTEPEPERQGELDQHSGVRHQVDDQGIRCQPSQVELVEFAVEQHVVRGSSIHPGGAAALDHA